MLRKYWILHYLKKKEAQVRIQSHILFCSSQYYISLYKWKEDYSLIPIPEVICSICFQIEITGIFGLMNGLFSKICGNQKWF